jgi:hypothetical protein
LKEKKLLMSTPLLTVLSTSRRTSVIVLMTLSIKLYITLQWFGALFWSSLRKHSIVQVEKEWRSADKTRAHIY